MSELLPCPFCGESVNATSNLMRGDDWEISCRSADCPIAPSSNGFFETEKAAIAAWNTRHQPAQLTEDEAVEIVRALADEDGDWQQFHYHHIIELTVRALQSAGALPDKPCPNVIASKGGTSHCALAESAVRERDELLRKCKEALWVAHENSKLHNGEQYNVTITTGETLKLLENV